MLQITELISIPAEQLEFSASRSAGPGGQNVNKLSTKVMLRFDVAHSPSLSPEQKELIMRRLRTRIGKDGVLRVISQKTRSQAANRQLAVERFVELMQSALKPVPSRKKTKASKAAILRRLDKKNQRSILKRGRSARIPLED